MYELATGRLPFVGQTTVELYNRIIHDEPVPPTKIKPQLTKGKAIKVNPLIVKGYNMDFDGDTASVHVPITEDARQESFNLLPSNNLWGPREGELMHHPSLEAVAGLYTRTRLTPRVKRLFEGWLRLSR